VRPRKPGLFGSAKSGQTLYYLIYGTSQNHIDRLTLAKMFSDIHVIELQAGQVLAIMDLFVLPISEAMAGALGFC